MSDDQVIIAGMPASEKALRELQVKDYIPHAGSVLKPCAYCGEPVYVGPRQQAKLRETPHAIVGCFRCVVRRHTPNDEIKHLGGNGASVELLDGTIFDHETEHP